MWLLVGSLTLLGPTPEARTRGYELEWESPPECPTRDEVEGAIDRRLGTLPPNPRGVVHARAHIEVDSKGRYGLELVLDDGDRKLDSPRCDELADAAALIVAIAVNPDAALADPGPVVPAPVSLEPAPAPEPAVDVTPTATRTRTAATRPWFYLRLAGAFGYGPVPAPAGGISFAFGLSGRHYRTELEGTYWPARAIESRSNASVGGSFRMGTALARGCGVVGGPRDSSPGFVVAVPLCGGLEIGAISGEGQGSLDANAETGVYLAARVGPQLAVHPPRGRGVGLFVSAEATFPIVQPTFVTAPSGVVYEPLPAGFVAALGVAWQIPTRLPRNRPETPRTGS
jgi:hypothetical protein